MLQQILEVKKEEITKLDREFEGQPNQKKVSLYEAIANSSRKPALIAEVKKASPSKGVIKEHYVPSEIAASYEQGGAAAISVLTDQRFFRGHAADLVAVKQMVSLPVLRKDFIIDKVQIRESAHIGADAILLIAAAMDPGKLHELYEYAREENLDCLVEVHSVEELEGVLNVFTPKLIGINNRDLRTFKTDVTHTEAIARHIPDGILTVSESGIKTAEDLTFLREHNIDAILVGETLMRASSPGKGIQLLYGE
ncbi:indole-3-glycerol phosphate synthase [Fictibacillus enclensis]|uniref:Indole-3-glycerol phosphate synthase n=1 Tax=Fictibacillus enclensis TaxID=1017270 RepID=A0A0V8JF39_9BACL|nr:indole-3-glycerol phosphate synthase TrpC [Fictibacillus enclensis]KSU85578.1 indole-3-glycerol phosphate synthase [Fictibacillus enclensis]SCB99135.1 indole-3-glycerol phosphate synthase [Fictibacillus enclensis]